MSHKANSSMAYFCFSTYWGGMQVHHRVTFPRKMFYGIFLSLLVITDTSGQRGHIVQVKRHSQKHNTVNDYYLNPHQDPSVQSLLH